MTLRIFIAERARASSPDPGRAVIGWIPFRDGLPGTEIELSSVAAVQLAGQARIGFRRVSSWPGTLAERRLPRVLARGLAHEIGHYVLHSRRHTPTGLMRASFTPEQVTRPSSAGLTLPPELAAQVRSRCLPDASRGAITTLRLESPGALRVR